MLYSASRIAGRPAFGLAQLLALVVLAAFANQQVAAEPPGDTPLTWRSTQDYPGSNWQQADFDDQAWNHGTGSFDAGRLWLRGTITLDTVPAAPQLSLTHRGEVKVYCNGKLVADFIGNTPHKVPVPIEGDALASLHRGANLIAIEVTCIGESPLVEVSWGQASAPGSVPAPLYRDPRFDGAADPVVIWNHGEQCWTMFYTQRRANLKHVPDVGYCYGCDIGMAVSHDGGRTWTYAGEAQGLEYKGGRNTFWAPEVVCIDGTYHMWVSWIEGVRDHWGGESTLTHFTSSDLRHWTFSDTLPMHDVIDAAIFPLSNKRWRMFYKLNSQTHMADSDDLKTWKQVGIAADDAGQEGPNVFKWQGRYWMIADVWHGQQVYTSEDLTHWTLQSTDTLLGEPGTRRDDQTFGRHADVLVQGDRAFILYFTHPGGDTHHTDATSLKRTSVQVAELEIKDGKLTCNRNKPLNYTWDETRTDW